MPILNFSHLLVQVAFTVMVQVSAQNPGAQNMQSQQSVKVTLHEMLIIQHVDLGTIDMYSIHNM